MLRHLQCLQESGALKKYADRWSQQEQSSVAVAASEVLDALAKANRAYEAKFGYTFIVCATGKNANEMLVLLEQRLHNSPEMEIKNAAEQQRLVLRLALEKAVKRMSPITTHVLDTTAGEPVAGLQS
jgi:OHCU decarboxylase